MSTENETEETCTDPGCAAHDPHHWRDDVYHTTEVTKELLQQSARYSDMVEAIKATEPEDNPHIARFALAYVDAETGLIEVIGNPGANPLSIVNLLTRAASIVAYQEWAEENAIKKTMVNMIYGTGVGERGHSVIPGGNMPDAIRKLFKPDPDNTVEHVDNPNEEDERIRRLYP